MFAKVSDEDLARRLTDLAVAMRPTMARFLRLLAEFDRRRLWELDGARSAVQWLALRCELSFPTAREQVRVARRLTTLPLTADALDGGRLSYSKVRAITRIATPKDEAELIAYASGATTDQLEQIVRARRMQLAIADPVLRRRMRYVRTFVDGAGCINIRGCLAPEDGAPVVAALERAERELERVHAGVSAGAGEDPPPAGVSAEAQSIDTTWLDGSDSDLDAAPVWERRRADALTWLAERYLRRAGSVRARQVEGGRGGMGRLEDGPDRALIVVHAEPRALAGDVGARCELRGGPRLHPETARRFGCDAALVLIGGGVQGAPRTVGRRTRVIPRPMRRELAMRDRGCRFPSCRAWRQVDAHHIDHWANGGETSLSNLITLCRTHHRSVHELGFKLLPTPNRREVAFHRPDGMLIARAPLDPRVGAPEIRARA